MATAVARAYNGGLEAEPRARSKNRLPGEGSGGQSLPETEVLLVFRHSVKAANKQTFVKFGNATKSDICAIFAENHGWP